MHVIPFSLDGRGEAGPRGRGAVPFTYTNSGGQLYYLHGKTVTLQNGRPMIIYAFARTLKTRKALDSGRRQQMRETPR